MGEWFVSPSGNNAALGTIGAPFATISHAVVVSNDGDVIKLRAGTYPERVVIGKSLTIQAWRFAESTAFEPVTIQAPADGKTEVVLIRDAHNVTLNGVIIDAVNSRRGISINNSKDADLLTYHIQILNFEIKNCVGYRPGERGQGVIITGVCSDVLLQDFSIHNVTAQGVDGEYAHAIYASCVGLVIRRGLMFDLSCNGIHFYGSGNGTCLVDSCFFTRCAIGIGFYTGICEAINCGAWDINTAFLARYDVVSARFYFCTSYNCTQGLDLKNFYGNAVVEAANNVLARGVWAVNANSNLGTISAHHNLRSEMTQPDQAVGANVHVQSINALFYPVKDSGGGKIKPLMGNPALGAGLMIDGISTDCGDRTRGNPPTLGAWELPETFMRVRVRSLWVLIGNSHEMKVAVDHPHELVSYSYVADDINGDLVVDVMPVNDILLAELQADSAVIIDSSTILEPI